MKKNILLNTDSYKVGMWDIYPQGTRNVFSYIESRGGKHRNIVFFGLQAFIKEYLTDPLTMEDVEEAISLLKLHGMSVNEDNLRSIVTKHNGFLPVRIKAVEEGSVVPAHNILVSIEATDEAFYWLPTWLETAMLRAVWYPSTVATNSREIKILINRYLNETGDAAGLDFKLHDFGARGTSTHESSVLGGMAHLINFKGTDTLAGIRGAMHFYGADVCGFSINASEHSISTSYGKTGEVEYVRQMIKANSKFPIFANVADTYDIFGFVHMLGTVLYDEVVALGEQNRTMVVRPDSGDPVEVPIKVIEDLMDYFGFEVNRKGYKVLPSFLRVIQGDGINQDSISKILHEMERRGLSADNIAFGMGGQLLGAPQRDDQKWAMKASAININGEWKGISKSPVTDPGKISKEGRLTLVENRGLGSISVQTVEEKYVGNRKVLMDTVFENGKLLKEVSFEKVRENAKI